MRMSNAQVISKAKYDEAIATIADREGLIARLEARVSKLQQLLFGRRSEKQVILPGAPFQSELFSDAEYEVSEPEDDSEPAPKKKRGKSKPRFDEDVEREIIDVELDERDRECEDCGGRLEDIGVETSERAHIIPARVVVRETRRHKYACGCKGAGVCSAPLPPSAFPKSRVTDETRAHVVVQKFVDHCPYYRQSAILRRSGVEISDRTLCHYGIESADRLAPIVVAMRDELLASNCLQADETTIPVLKTEKAKPGAHRGYLWAYAQPRGTIVYDYCRSRAGDHPRGFLEGYEGILQTDRYGAYDSITARSEITDVACWAHARRRFVEAAKTTSRRAKPVLHLIAKLYAVEKRAREANLAPADRARLRREVATPILQEVENLLREMVIAALPESVLGDAISYSMNHWPALVRYVDHGEAEIDNNLIENSMRPVVLGRKNYLFAGSEIGAEAAAILYSLTESCRRLKIHVYSYLVDVFRQLATVDPTNPEDIRALTPARWKAQQESRRE
jgi:transposase